MEKDCLSIFNFSIFQYLLTIEIVPIKKTVKELYVVYPGNGLYIQLHIANQTLLQKYFDHIINIKMLNCCVHMAIF